MGDEVTRGTNVKGKVVRGKKPDWLKRVLTASGCELDRQKWIDHEGTLKDGERTYFVSEPYGLFDSGFKELMEFVSETGCGINITSPGEWHSSTIRIALSPPPHEDDFRYFQQPSMVMDWPLDYTVYGLRDPRDGLFHYVGQTANLERRIGEHKTGRGYDFQEKYMWIRGLADAGLEFSVSELEKATWETVRGCEKKWILKLRHEGHPILSREYGRKTSTAPEEWRSMALGLWVARNMIGGLVARAGDAVGARHAATQQLVAAQRSIDKARCRLDSALWSLLKGAVDLDDCFYTVES